MIRLDTRFPHARKSAALEAEDTFMAAHGGIAAGSILAWVEALAALPETLRSGMRWPMRGFRARSGAPDRSDYSVRPSRST